jgi:D-alanyl-D-alanine carboxypeptidase
LVIAYALLLNSAVWAFSPDDDLSARALLLMDAKSGKILYQKNAHVPLPPASTTKILTAVLTLESQKRSTDRLIVSKAATRVPASKLYLKPGQTVSIEDLLYGVLLASANDASVVLAEGIGVSF